ncbi:MAG: ABC transporter ATP-binding protein/permease [Oscillospiraceae bacterium]|nr:ABC transporter ATP-binding protein/permease [Oscillospiraceae bacterium]
MTATNRVMRYVQRVMYTKEYAADLKSTDVHKFINNAYAATGNKHTSIVVKYGKKLLLWFSLSEAIYPLKDLVVIVYIAYGLISGSIESIGVYTSLLTASQYLTVRMQRITDQLSNLDKLNKYAEKIRKYFDLESTIERNSGDKGSPSGAMSLELRGVSFAYPNSEFALKNLNITVKPGEKIAIVGENGAGKTTLSKLLLRLYDVSGGEILYNGVNVRDYDVHTLRRRIGVAFQEPQIYALTVRENLSVYHKSDDATLREVLCTVGLDVELDREVTREFDEGGVMLSGGEQQKLGLSRLLHGDFGLLLLDEPSSALDPLAEYEMTKLMFDNSHTTTIMVAHRLSTIRDADCIYLISDGGVAEQGTHDELMALGGRYAEMFTKQAENYVR